MGISREFVNFVAAIRPQPAQKQRIAKPGTIGSMNKTQIAALIKSSLSRDVLAKRGAAGAKPDTKLEDISRGLASGDLFKYLKFKGIQGMEGKEALQLLLGMTPAERADVLATLEKIQAAATEWNMVPADLIDLLK